MSSHSHAFFQLVIVIRGSQSARLSDATHTVSAGNILLFKPGIEHEEWSEGKKQLETIFMACTWPDCPEGLQPVIKDKQGRAQTLMEMLYQEDNEPVAERQNNCRTLLAALQQQIISAWQHPYDPLQEKVHEHIRQSLSENISLEALSEAVHMSKYHFLRRFKEITGHTPMAVVRQLRLNRARDLILSGDTPLKEIAELCGFNDVYNMTRSFSKYLGYPPGSLRR